VRARAARKMLLKEFNMLAHLSFVIRLCILEAMGLVQIELSRDARPDHAASERRKYNMG
jgi:hypothetical protein